MTEDYISDEPIYEIKGHGNEWKLFYPDEGDILSPFPWYDKEGKLKTVIHAGGSSGKLTETNETFNTAKDALDYAKRIGAENIKLIKSKPRKPKED
ncbi:MAG: hypothetical protein ACHQ1D_01385 [Nitrososphaerales archaeon]